MWCKQVLTAIFHNTIANAMQASANSNIAQHNCECRQVLTANCTTHLPMQFKQVLTSILHNTLANPSKCKQQYCTTHLPMHASDNTNIAQHTSQCNSSKCLQQYCTTHVPMWCKQVLTAIFHNTIANAMQASANSNIAQHTVANASKC